MMVCGIATAGVNGIATAGDHGTARAGYNGHTVGRRRWCMGEVGVDGIEAGVPYRVQDGKLVRAEVTSE